MSFDFGRYAGRFEAFRSKSVKLYRKTQNNGYSREEDGSTVTVIDEFTADIQPYNIRTESGGIDDTAIGADYSQAVWMYTNPNENILPGLFAEVDGAEYIVAYVVQRGMCTRSLLRISN